MYAHPPFIFFGSIDFSMLNFIPNFLSIEIYFTLNFLPIYFSTATKHFVFFLKRSNQSLSDDFISIYCYRYVYIITTAARSTSSLGTNEAVGTNRYLPSVLDRLQATRGLRHDADLLAQAEQATKRSSSRPRAHSAVRVHGCPRSVGPSSQLRLQPH
jgi:hypothetical protein